MNPTAATATDPAARFIGPGAWRHGLGYGLLGLPLAFVALPLYVLLPDHYARTYDMPLATLGAVLLALYAGFAWKQLRDAHFDHHKLAGRPGDPDFDEHNPGNFLRWYGTFFRRYFGWRSILYVHTVVGIYWLVLDISMAQIVLLYGLPALGSSLQLFYFGTFRPHRHARRQGNLVVPHLNTVLLQLDPRAVHQPELFILDGIVGDVGQGVLRDRKVLAAEGVVVVVVTVDIGSGKVLTGPEIITRGWVYAPEAEDLLDEACDVVAAAVEKALAEGVRSPEALEKDVRRAAGRFVNERTKRRPMIVPVVMEA